MSWWGRRFHLPGPTMPEYRGRLPHIHPNDAYLFLTGTMWGSLPAKANSTGDRTPGYASWQAKPPAPPKMWKLKVSRGAPK
ncbi:MAG: hypothetical protein M3Z85_21920, partial [Acidobacteriota bacterium]|nr:hypothetical protein [Acidobacteriota bacterium]